MAVTKTAAGTYVCDFRDQDGHRIRKTFDKHKDADNYEKEMLALVAKREYRRPSHLTVGEVAEKWFSRKAGIEQDEQPRKSELSPRFIGRLAKSNQKLHNTRAWKYQNL